MTLRLAVLIVEDSKNDAFFITHLLKKAGYEVVSKQVETAAQMRAALEKQAWDIVISDYSLPQFDGRAALTLLQETGRDIPFIVVSGAIGEETAVSMMKAGAHDYLMKDDLTRLAPAVERELAQAKIRREQKQAEAALLQSEERYRLLVEQLPVVIYRDALDELATTHFISPQIENLTGYSPEEWIMDAPLWHNILHPDDRERVLAENRRHMLGEPFLSEYRLIGRDGRVIWVRDEAVIVRDSAGSPRYAQGVISNITERKQAEMERQVLLEIMQGLVTTKDLQNFLRLVHQSIAKVIYAENFFVLLYNKETALFEEIYSVDKFDLPAPPSNLDKSISAYVFRTGQPQLINRPRFEELESQGELELVGTDSLSWLGVPLKTSAETIGVMVVQDYDNSNRYSERDIDFLASIAGQVAQVVERKQAEQALAASEAELRALFASMQDVVLVIDRQGLYLKIAPTNPDLLVKPPEELLGKTLGEIFPPELAAYFLKAIGHALDTHQTTKTEYPLAIGKDTLWFETFISPMNADSTLWVARDVTERKKAEETLRQHLTELEMLYESGLAFSQLMNPRETAQKILDLIEEKLAWSHTTLRLYHPQDETLELLAFRQPALKSEEERLAVEKRFKVLVARPGDGLSGWTFQHGQTVRSADVTNDPRYVNTSPDLRSGLYVPMTAGNRKIGVISIESEQFDAFSEADERLMTTLATQAAFALENARLFEETRQRVTELETLYLVSTALRAVLKEDEMLAIVLDQALTALHTKHGAIILWSESAGGLLPYIARGWPCDMKETPTKPGEGIFGKVFVDRETYISREFSSDPLTRDISREQIPVGWGGACIPIRSAEQMLGVLLVSVPSEWELTKDEVRQISTLAEMTGTALHRMRLHDETVRRLEQLQALRAVDQAITSNFDLNPILDTILYHTLIQLRVDAAAVLLLQPNRQTLEYVAGQGFRTDIIKTAKLRLGESLAGQAALERHTIQILNSDEALKRPGFDSLWIGEGFVTNFVVPLISKDEIKGVLEVFHRTPLTSEPDWIDFLETLAKQTAIAIDNTQLFNGLQRANQELVQAYEATIEGWSRALDLRDQETENHTLRVTSDAEILAEALGMTTAERVHVRRGALLHDIGKMGVPDNILLKPGPLSDEERAIIERHPWLAYQMLAPITYLRQAIEIPFCHHEKWDGSGYPQGLKGEHIPLSARIFAIVDVWDALTSDRPYRQAWTKARTIEYIREESGKHFDPKIVAIFLDVFAEGRV